MLEIATAATIASPRSRGMPWGHTSGQTLLDCGVFFEGIVYGGTGYAEEGWVIAVALAEAGVPVQLVPIGPQVDHLRLLPSPARQSLERLSRQRVELSRSILYQHAMAYLWNMEVYGHVRIDRTMFETDRIPDGLSDRCYALNEVWLPSEFNRQTFTAAGVEPSKLRVVHAGVDTDLFRPDAQALRLPHLRGFNFLSVL